MVDDAEIISNCRRPDRQRESLHAFLVASIGTLARPGTVADIHVALDRSQWRAGSPTIDLDPAGRAWDSMLYNFNMPQTEKGKAYVLRHSLATLARNRGTERWNFEGVMGHRFGSRTENYVIGDFSTMVTALESITADLDTLKSGTLYQTVTGAGRA